MNYEAKIQKLEEFDTNKRNSEYQETTLYRGCAETVAYVGKILSGKMLLIQNTNVETIPFNKVFKIIKIRTKTWICMSKFLLQDEYQIQIQF